MERKPVFFSSIRPMNNQEKYAVLGLMSGSSLDGLDMALCEFQREVDGGWSGQILKTETRPFPIHFLEKLKSLPQGTALELAEADFAFSVFSSGCVLDFLVEAPIKPLLISSHGHTVFHQPHHGFTTQIGNGGILAAQSGLPVVCDFRSTDVGLGGQGAPLVPGAEQFLFSDFDSCLNMGGIANISFPKNSQMAGFDISPCNQLLNHAAAWLGLEYDYNGDLAALGKPIPELIQRLEAIPFYSQRPPKSLGNEDVRSVWLPLIGIYRDQPESVMHSLCLHVAKQIAASVSGENGKLLVTGGGAFHEFLRKTIQDHLPEGWELILPSSEMVGFKEAYCFAFLGLKRWLGEVNCFARHTGARQDSSLGAVYL